MKDIIVIGESHTRSFALRNNLYPFFMGNGKEINLFKKNIDSVNKKINQVLNGIDNNKSLVFLYLGEPNCRYVINDSWDIHWKILKGQNITFDIDKCKDRLNSCIENMKILSNKIDYLITPTTALDITNTTLKYFNTTLKQEFGDKVIDIFEKSIDEELKTLDEFKSNNWEKDPIHLNSGISDVFLNILHDNGIIDDKSYYNSTVNTNFDTHFIRDNQFEISKFGSYVIKNNKSYAKY